ncbi:DUF2515 family protein [Mesorhizobium retamae]|uniref:DUF4150 domain-containing protein n=1 Tax=Mesorhizobium retamae TaxID=2912854 RepID=A0ABS9QP72_9HYPH|nr:PAAR-like domain-containing protein [Mesorhizobium sp. IRAMC:0171]MCG7509246.1 DUF4150 domain-containing protein [Mesorhizobium sp. IRAMC:0171]
MSKMAMVSARKCASNVIASRGPDVCLTPVGSAVVPVAYSSMVTLDKAVRYSPSVRDNGKFDLQLNTAVPGVTGHEPGTEKGAVSPGYKGIGLVDIASPFVYSEGFATWHHRQDAWINRPDPGPREPQKALEDKTIKSECKQRIEAIERETNAITAIEDPIERNKAITAAYDKLAREDPSNRWIKLASIVSVQGGCSMKLVRSLDPDVIAGLDPDPMNGTGLDPWYNMYQALGDANKAIFRDIYPFAAFRARHGYEQMKKCYAAEKKNLPPEIQKAFQEIDNGNLRAGADNIAMFEQMKIVQPVYEKYSGTFGLMEVANKPYKLISGKNTYDIPVSTQCGDSNTVPFRGEIANPRDRVGYYNDLMNALERQQGW